MPILIKKESLYPSVTKPGLYFFDNLVESFIDEDGNEVPINWDELTGIDYDEPNRFKFALGTWTEFTRNNRAIKIYSSNKMDFINLGLNKEPSEPKPASPPDGYLENTEENALLYEPKPPKQSWKLFSGYKSNSTTLGNLGGLFGLGFVDDFDPMFAPVPYNEEYIQKGMGEGGKAPTARQFADELQGGDPTPNYAIKIGSEHPILVGPRTRSPVSARSIELTPVYVFGADDRRGGWVKGGHNWSTGGLFGGVQKTHKIDAEDFPFHSESPTSAHPEFKLYNVKGGDSGAIKHFEEVKGSDLTEEEIAKIGRGYWRVDLNDIKRKEAESFGSSLKKTAKKIAFFVVDIVKSGELKTYKNIYFEYDWKPNLDNIPYLNRAGAYHIPSFEWVWTGKDWIPAETLLAEPQSKSPKNEYIGIPIISDTKPNMENVYSFEEQGDPTVLPVFHDRRIPNYNKTAAPLKIWYNVNFYQQDLDELFVPNTYKFHIIEWGDEETKLSVEDIEFSEFFALYDTDDDGFQREQAKRLVQIIKQAEYFTDENSKLNFIEHVYLTSGVKTIRAVVFRLNETEDILFETTLITTNINVGETDESLESFNLYGSDNFNILPLKIDKKELVIGAVDEKSDYVESLKKIEEDDFYGQEDYLEKTYIEEFLPKTKASEFGNYLGKMDLSITRLFNKPYDISYFTSSKAIDILIDDNDCLIEFNPNEVDNNRIENTGKSDDVGFVIGDYKLIKRKNEEMKKEDVMLLPEIQKQKDKQAI